jgi:hypothetical protein
MPGTRPSLPPVPADVARDVLAFVRTLVTAARSQQMYSSDHPTAVQATERCRDAVGAVASHEGLQLGITPETLLVNGTPLAPDPRVREACALMNGHDILRMRILARPAFIELSNFLLLLSFDPDAIRQRGGPARIWENYGHYWLQIDQINYDTLLAGAAPGTVTTASRRGDTNGAGAKAIPRDDVWQSLVRSMSDGRQPIDVTAEDRLLQIARSAEAICELATDAADAQSAEGVLREAAQAAAILMTFQRLSSFVELRRPYDHPAVLNQITEAASKTSPSLLLRAVHEAAESGLGTDVIKAIGERFDDDQVAGLLATTLAVEGKASARIAAALNTLVPDEERRARILRLARHLIGQGDPQAAVGVTSVWHTLEQFLEGPADAAYVSRMYGESIEHIEARANRLRLDAPAKLDEWVRSVSAESVRSASATVLLDLFGLDRDPAGVAETAHDLAALADDLLLAGDTAEAAHVAMTLAEAADADDADRRAASRAALGELARAEGLRETLEGVAAMGEAELNALGQLLTAVGPAAAPVLVHVVASMPHGEALDRLQALLASFHDDGVAAIEAALESASPAEASVLVATVGEIGGPRVIRLLHSWAKGVRTELLAPAARALAASPESGAAAALASLLRSGSPATKTAVINGIMAVRSAAGCSAIAEALGELNVLGSDFDFAVQLLGALRTFAIREGVLALSKVLHLRSWRAWRRAAHLRELAAIALAATPGPEARQILAEAARRGPFVVKRAIRAVRAPGV